MIRVLFVLLLVAAGVVGFAASELGVDERVDATALCNQQLNGTSWQAADVHPDEGAVVCRADNGTTERISVNVSVEVSS